MVRRLTRDMGHVLVAACVPLLMCHKEWYVFMIGLFCMYDPSYDFVDLHALYHAVFCGSCIYILGIEYYAFIISSYALLRYPTHQYVMYANWDRRFYDVRYRST